MKKFLFAVLAAVSMTAHAQTTVPVIWPFSLASTQGVMVREIVQEANTNQKKYLFVLEHKPGGGGAVAVQHLLNSKSPAALAHTNSFFLRPYINQDGWYDVNALQMSVAFCENQPLAVMSKNIVSVEELSKRKNVTIGIIPGSITQLVSSELGRAKNMPQLTEVGFKGTPEITLSMLGDHIDLSVDFLASVQNDQIRVLGLTGSVDIASHRTFKSLGFPGFEDLTNSYYLFIDRTLDPKIAQEISQLLTVASQTTRVKELCRKDYGLPANISGAAAQKLAERRHDFWSRQVRSAAKK